MAKVKAVPDGYHTVTPYLMIEGCAKALDFYKQAFGAEERMRMPGPGGKIVHSEIQVGDSVVMMADTMPDMPGAQPFQAASLCLYVEDCDALFGRAVAAGAKVERPLADQFYGDRSGTVRDPFGHQWTIMTHKEDVSPEEMERRMANMKPPG